MKTPTCRQLTVVSMTVLLIILPTLGCVTKSDLTKSDLTHVQRDLSSDIEAARQDLGVLRRRVDSIQHKAKQDTSTSSDLEARMKILETAYQTELGELNKRVAALHKRLALSTSLQNPSDLEARMKILETAYQTELGELNKRVAALHKRLALSTSLQNLEAFSRTLLRHYQSEAGGLRGHLKEIEEVAKELEPFADMGTQR